jgi:hypothetical protein
LHKLTKSVLRKNVILNELQLNTSKETSYRRYLI